MGGGSIDLSVCVTVEDSKAVHIIKTCLKTVAVLCAPLLAWFALQRFSDGSYLLAAAEVALAAATLALTIKR